MDAEQSAMTNPLLNEAQQNAPIEEQPMLQETSQTPKQTATQQTQTSEPEMLPISPSVYRKSSASINLIVGEEENQGVATNFGTIINVCNNIFGVGLLTLPYAFSKFSLIPGYVLIFLMCALSIYTFVLLARVCSMTNQYNYRDMATALYGKAMGYIVQGIMLCYTFGSCIAHAAVVGDNFIECFKLFFPDIELLQNRAFIVPIMAVVFIFPISMCKTLQGLRFTSVLAVSGVIVCTIAAVIEECLYGKVNETVSYASFSTDTFLAMPVMCVAFASHYNAPRYYMELKNRSIPRFFGLLCASFGIVLFTYYLIGTSGYLQFGSATVGNILNNYDTKSIYATIARLCMGINMVFSYPMAYFSLRTSVHCLFFPHIDMENFWYRLVNSIVLVGTTVALSIVVPSISTIVGFNGALFGGIIIFFFPGLLFLTAKNKQDGNAPIYKSVDKMLSILCMIIGVCVCVGGTYLKVIDLMKN